MGKLRRVSCHGRLLPVCPSSARNRLEAAIVYHYSGFQRRQASPLSSRGVRSYMPASMPNNHSKFTGCVPGSNPRSAAGRESSRALALMLLGIFLAAVTASAQEHRIQLEDLTKIVTVSDPQISPDGKSIVCVVSRQNFEEDRSDGELVLVDVATRAQRVLTFDRKGVGSPRWSPSGDRLAFVAVVPYTKEKKDDATKRGDAPQVFIMSMSGGDAKKVTNAPNGVEQFAWRPNGKNIAYVSTSR